MGQLELHHTNPSTPPETVSSDVSDQSLHHYPFCNPNGLRSVDNNNESLRKTAVGLGIYPRSRQHSTVSNWLRT